MKNILARQLIILAMITLTIACSGDKTFNDYARAGDTVAVAGGHQPNFNLNNISIEIRKGGGAKLGPIVATYLQGDPAIRASVNLYADPLSSLIVSRETGIDLTTDATTYQETIANNFTSGDKDWFQTTVFVDIPPTLITGKHTIIVKNTLGESFKSVVDIISGVGTPSTFTAFGGTDLTPDMIAGVSRLPHYTVDVAGSTIPHAIELTLTHDPDSTAGGTGKAYAVNPIGYKKNLAWTDDGTTMKVILTPTTNTTPDSILDYKFYVTGAINNLVVGSVSAFDINGNSVSGVSATPVFSN